MSKQKPKICVTKKVLQKGLETKKNGLGRDWTHGWPTVWLRGFDRNAPQKMTSVPCLPSTSCLQHAVINEPKQLSISNQHFRVPRLRAFNFAQFPLRYVLRMQSNSIVKTEFWKTCLQKYWYSKKICSPTGFEPATSWMQVSCTTNWAIWLWFSMECCSSFLHFFVFKRL